MNSILAYEIGAVFLFAAMLMFGSAHGFIPRSLRNIGAPILVGVALVGFLIWRFGPDLYANARSTAAPWFATPEPATSAAVPPEAPPELPSARAAAPAPVKSGVPKAHVATPAYPAANGIVIRDVVPVPADPARPIVEPARPIEAAAPMAQTPSTEKVAEAAPLADTAGSSPAGSSPYDSGAKRVVKSIGHFLHIGGKKKEPDPQ